MAAGTGAELPLTSPERLVDYAASLDCIHCGLCLATCPTYRLTGSEASSPRGRIHLMRAVAEGRLEPGAPYAEELDFCLVCRHCESVCPAGVRFGEMMEVARDAVPESARPRGRLERLARRLGFELVLPSRRWLAAAGLGLRLLQRTGLARIAARLAGPRGAALCDLPRADRARLPAVTPPKGPRAGAVAVLEGCAMPELFGRVNVATARALAARGQEVRAAPDHACCGALHAHNGELEGARALARRTIEAFDALRGDDGEPLPAIVNSAGCGAHMKEYGRLLAEDPTWAERARAFAARVRDLAEHLVSLPAPSSERAPAPAEPLVVAWDDPCHLCHGQQIRRPPRDLLDALPGVRRVEMHDAEQCCGSAGIYSLLRPADSAAVLDDKLRAFRASGARALVTANPGCHLQWAAGFARAGIDAPVLHLAELVAPPDAMTNAARPTRKP